MTSTIALQPQLRLKTLISRICETSEQARTSYLIRPNTFSSDSTAHMGENESAKH